MRSYFFKDRTYRKVLSSDSKIFRRIELTQYSKRMVMVHWLTLALLVAAFFLGHELAESTDESKATVLGYQLHALAGITILLLSLTRLYFRKQDGTPPALGQTPMDKMAKGIHHLLYTLLVVLPISGFVTVVTSDAIKGLQANDAALLPKDDGFENVFAHEVHEVLGAVLIAIVALHVLGAIKHHFIMKDGLMERMMLRRKD
jgi:cytochrome b561